VVVDGVWISDGEIQCTAPSHSAGSVVLQVATSSDAGFLSSQVLLSISY
jgi:hypothetical protein